MFLDDTTRLQHMLDAACEAVSFIDKLDRSSLDDDRQLTLSLLKLLEITGEAARGISENLRGKHPNIPWQSMIGMRNRLTHGYFDVNLDVVWQTVKQDLPPLIIALKNILANSK